MQSPALVPASRSLCRSYHSVHTGSTPIPAAAPAPMVSSLKSHMLPQLSTPSGTPRSIARSARYPCCCCRCIRRLFLTCLRMFCLAALPFARRFSLLFLRLRSRCVCGVSPDVLRLFCWVPNGEKSRVLNWGIIGAVSMRAIMIVVGVAAIQRFR